jgi:Zn-dependent metalloprotease
MKKFSWSLFGILLVAGLSGQSLMNGQLSGLETDGKGRVFLAKVNSAAVVDEAAAPSFIAQVIGNSALTVVADGTERDAAGFTHTKFRIEKEGVALAHKRIIAHFSNGSLSVINGDLELSSSFEGTFSITESQALAAALQKVGASSYKWDNTENEQAMKTLLKNPAFTYQPQGTKVYLEKDNVMIAAWRFNIYATTPLYRANVYVNATTGSVIEEENLLCTVNVPGSVATKYSGTQTVTVDQFGSIYRMRQTTSGQGIETYNLNNGTNYNAAVDFTNATSSWTTTGNDQGAGDAHWGAEKTHAYYLTQHSRNSLDNAGMKLISFVHYDIGFMNAFWDGQVMTYGDGNGTSWRIFAALDVCGHEITHGLTENTAGLLYQNESGALNESFSDMFGANIENFARPSNWNWKVGEDITSNGIGLRTMSNPGQFGDPDTYKGQNWFTGTSDNGGVHTNSGVPNFWYYLLVTGGSGTNDLSNAFSVQGLGFNVASKIAFRALTVYFTPNTDFMAARAACIQAAKDLYGDCSNEMIQTANAWYAVGVGQQLSTTSPLPNFLAKSLSFCSVPATVNFMNTTGYAQVYHWDFGDGSVSSAVNPAHTYTTSGSYTVKLKASAPGCNMTDSLTKTSYVVVDVPQPPTVISNTTCYGTSLALFANANGLINWYQSPTGTVSFQSGVMLGIPSVTMNRTYYVNNTYTFGPLTGGIPAPMYGSLNGNNSRYLIFDVFQHCTLNSVVMAVPAAGTRIIELRNAANNVLASKTVSFTASGASTVTLDFVLTPGTNYQLGLGAASTGSVYRSTTNVNYPYDIGGHVSIKGSSAGSSAYYWFYKWSVTPANCESSKVAVSASVVPLPIVTAGVSSEIVCVGDMVPVTVSPQGGLLHGTGVVGTSFQAASSGSFALQYNYFDGNGCMNSSSVVMYAQDCLGLAKDQSDNINVYPNPAHDLVSVSGLSDGMFVRVTDLNGRQLSSVSPVSGECKLDISGFTSGLYLVTITSAEGQVLSSHRIVKQ